MSVTRKKSFSFFCNFSSSASCPTENPTRICAAQITAAKCSAQSYLCELLSAVLAIPKKRCHVAPVRVPVLAVPSPFVPSVGAVQIAPGNCGSLGGFESLETLFKSKTQVVSCFC